MGSQVLEKGLYFHFTCSEFKGEGKTRSSLRHHASCFVENGHGGDEKQLWASFQLLCAGSLGQMGRNEDGQRQVDFSLLKVEIPKLNCGLMTNISGLYVS